MLGRVTFQIQSECAGWVTTIPLRAVGAAEDLADVLYLPADGHAVTFAVRALIQAKGSRNPCDRHSDTQLPAGVSRATSRSSAQCVTTMKSVSSPVSLLMP